MKPGFETFAKLGVPHPCCVPSQQRALHLQESRRASAERQRATGGSREGMIHIPGGRFLMGTEAVSFPADGEGPVREVSVDGFLIDAEPVRNWQFQEFVAATSFRTEAERFGWSFVFRGHIPPERYTDLVDQSVPSLGWWCKVNGADWRHPEGPDSHRSPRAKCWIPVVHVSWNDALSWCAWARKRLPTEAGEWEYRGPRRPGAGNFYPWGDEFRHRMAGISAISGRENFRPRHGRGRVHGARSSPRRSRPMDTASTRSRATRGSGAPIGSMRPGM